MINLTIGIYNIYNQGFKVAQSSKIYRCISNDGHNVSKKLKKVKSVVNVIYAYFDQQE